MTETITELDSWPELKCLDAMCSLGLCNKSQDTLEVGDREYQFEIKPDNFIDLIELENLKKQFRATEVKISYYCCDGHDDDVRLSINLYYYLGGTK